MGSTVSDLFCADDEPEVSVEHGDAVPNAQAIHAALAAGLVESASNRNEELQAHLPWRIDGPTGHSTIESPQDLEGPCLDLRANELWVVVPTDTFLDKLANLSDKVKQGEPLVLWRGAATHAGWQVRYAGGELSTEWITAGQAALLWHQFAPTMHSKSLPEAEVAKHAAAALQRYHAFCAAAEQTPGTIVG